MDRNLVEQEFPLGLNIPQAAASRVKGAKNTNAIIVTRCQS
jgi:hypothetical protein